MAVIYGTPVILLQKPDASEQWLINSVVSLEPYVEAGKEKEFNVNFTSNNTSYSRIMLGGPAHLIMYGDPIINAGSGGSMQEAYRQITLEKPVTGELKTWLEANAVKMPLEGTWVFNETLSNPSFLSQTAHNVSIQANSNSHDITAMRFELRNDTGAMEISYVVPGGNSFSAYHETWTNAAYRAITFTEPVKYYGNEEFVRWFVDNAVQISTRG